MPRNDASRRGTRQQSRRVDPAAGITGEPEQTGSLRARAISEIRSRIQTGALAADHTFSEVTICEELGMSRAPVREALIALSSGGWLEPLPRAGWQVRALTLNEARNLMAVRAALAPAAAAAAARRAPHEDEAVAALQGYCDIQASDGPVDEAIVAMYRCLRRIARLSGNLEFDRCLEDVLSRLVRYYLLAPVREALRSESIPIHPVVAAVLAGDSDAAHDQMLGFVTRDQRRLTEAIIDSDLVQSVKLTLPSGHTPTRRRDSA